MGSKKTKISRKNIIKTSKYLQITLEDFGLSQKSSEASKEITEDAQNSSNCNSQSYIQTDNPKEFLYRSKKNGKSNKNVNDTLVKGHDIPNTLQDTSPYDQILRACEIKEIEALISSKSTSLVTTSSNTQIQKLCNINEISQPKSKELSLVSGCNSGREKQSDFLNKFHEIDDKIALNDSNTRKSKADKIVLISSDNVHKDLQSTSEKVISASSEGSDTEKRENIQGGCSCTENKLISPGSCARNSKSSQDENNPSASKSKSKSKRQKRVITTANQMALGEIIVDDNNSHLDSLQNRKSENLQKVFRNSSKKGSRKKNQVLADGYKEEREAKFQLLRPEELDRKEFWHSYAYESRSPNYILCRFQQGSKNTSIKKVRFNNFVEVRKAIDISKDRKGHKRSKFRNLAVKIWFTGITETNTANNEKPEKNPIVTNIVWEDRTCDIHVYDPSTFCEPV